MTQTPPSGQGAPLRTEFGSMTAPRHADADSSANAAGAGTWGSTSTSRTGTFPDDAPTTSLPTYGAPSGARAAQQSPGAPAQNAAQSRSATRGSRTRGPRRARLQLRHINPWTVLKFSCVLSIALFFVWLIVVGVLFGVLDAAGIIGKINDAVTQLNGPGSKPPITAGIVFGGAAIIGVVNIILFIALTTIGSIIYNLCADLVGGVELTLSEA